MNHTKCSNYALKQCLILLSRKNELRMNISLSNRNQIHTQNFLSYGHNNIHLKQNQNTAPIKCFALSENVNTSIRHKQFFHAKKKKAKSKEIEMNKNLEDNDEHEESDKLVFLNDEMSDDEISDVVTNNRQSQNTQNLSNIQSEKEPDVKPSVERINKNVYVADNITIYDSILDLPENLWSTPLTEEEIEHINSGGANLNLGSYQSTITFIAKAKKEK